MSEKEANRREKFSINVKKHAEFPDSAKTGFLTSTEFCKLTSELFKATFADYEGCIFETTENNCPTTLSLVFNHGQYDEDAIVACERPGGKSVGSSIIDRTRTRDQQLREGDRYYLTEDGKDVVTSLLIPRFYNNGKPDWKKIVGDFVERNPYNQYNQFGQRPPQQTRVAYIDLNRVCSLLFGSKLDGEPVEYSVAVTQMPYYQMMPGMTNNYLLSITRVSVKEMTKMYEKLGFGSVGSQIIR